jgi:hypothetical protein
MSRYWAILGGSLVAAALLIAPAGARPQAASGDTCTVSGSGTQVTLHVNIPAGQQQFGFAFRIDGATITNGSIPGANGNFSTTAEALAPNTTAAWVSDAPLPGSSVVTLTTSGTAKSITIVPSVNASGVNSGSAPVFLDPVTCTRSSAVPAGTAIFSVAPRATYSPAAKAWHLVVAIPGPGTVSAVQPVPTVGTGYAKAATAKPLVQTRRMTLNTGGKVTLTLRPTSKGQTALAQNGSFKVQLRVTFDAQNGTSAHRTVSVTLAR